MTTPPRTDGDPSPDPSDKDEASRTSPRYQFRLHHLLLLPVLAMLALFVIEAMHLEGWRRQGTELVEIQVIDAQSRKPIAGASIQMTSAARTITATAQGDGRTALSVLYDFEGNSTLLRSKQTEAPWDIIVSAPGYSSSQSRLADHRLSPGVEGAFPTPIVIALSPADEAR